MPEHTEWVENSRVSFFIDTSFFFLLKFEKNEYILRKTRCRKRPCFLIKGLSSKIKTPFEPFICDKLCKYYFNGRDFWETLKREDKIRTLSLERQELL